jgi:Ribbon-helix-helix protein, copG family
VLLLLSWWPLVRVQPGAPTISVQESEQTMATTTTITVDATLKARIAELARHAGLDVDEFVEALLRRLADSNVRFERGVPALPRRAGAPTLTVQDVDRLANGPEA